MASSPTYSTGFTQIDQPSLLSRQARMIKDPRSISQLATQLSHQGPFHAPSWAQSDGFQLCLGENAEGQTVFDDLQVMPHLLLSGGTLEDRSEMLKTLLLVSGAIYGNRSATQTPVEMTVLTSPNSPLGALAGQLPAHWRVALKPLQALNELNRLCDTMESLRPSRVLEPVQPFLWTESARQERQSAGQNDDTVLAPSPLARLRTPEHGLKIVVIEETAGLLWGLGKPFRKRLERLLTLGPERGIHVVMSTLMLQIAPLGERIDKNQAGHLFIHRKAKGLQTRAAQPADRPIVIYLPSLHHSGLPLRAASIWPGLAQKMLERIPGNEAPEATKPVEPSSDEKEAEIPAREVLYILRRARSTSGGLSMEANISLPMAEQHLKEMAQRGLVVQESPNAYRTRIDHRDYLRSVGFWAQVS
ncbi:MAG TPA: hypothetical protein VL860_00370 [Planctomycetota bacterium]|nr:hypothetical protein [Planctomycetota bacterium]